MRREEKKNYRKSVKFLRSVTILYTKAKYYKSANKDVIYEQV